jgi:putative IMPACT (imprinted ancient) family translation regulator
VAVVVTRYFGGTKLGTGGLVRAYGDAVREVLFVLPRAVKVPTHTLRIDTPYSLYEQIRRLVGVHQGQMLDETFAGQVTMTMRLPQDRLPDLQSALQELSRGRIQAKVTKSSESTIVPLKTER